MRLRTRIALVLLAISVVLIVPALYGLSALQTLHGIAYRLSTRDAEAARELGQLQAALTELEQRQGYLYVVAAAEPTVEYRSAAERVQESAREVERALSRLAEVRYADAAASVTRRWGDARQAIAEEQDILSTGNFAAAEQYRAEVIDPAFQALQVELHPLREAINMESRRQVERAQDLAAGATTTVLTALAIALLLAILLSGLLTRTLLRPIHELRGAMAVVAEGDFDPEVRVSPDRPDELGDLARSFERMTEQLAELDRLKAEFISIASHELKTPLSVIRGYVSLLLEGIYGNVAEPQRKPLESVIEQTDRLGRLVQQLLEISRFEAGGGRIELRPVDLHELLAGLASSFEVLAIQNQIDFRLETTENLPDTVVGDPERLNEVVGNLLSNAFKFTPRGGKIRLRAGAGNGEVMIEVADTGIGVPADKLPRIFEKFYQIENEAQPRSVGSGLGLAIAREIVEAHGGTIAAESQLGRGTTFRVVLPQQPRPTNHRNTPPEPEAI